jgi:menaquinone-specific isochorismate synthase
VVKQNIAQQIDLSTFFKSGALLQTAPDQFKLILGPFKTTELNENDLIQQMQDQRVLVYQPDFWDFLHHSKTSLKVYLGEVSLILDRKSLAKLCSKAQPTQPQVAWQNVNSAPFKKQFEWSLQKFSENALSKTVPIISQVCKTRFTENNLAFVIQNLIREPHYGWAYGLWQDGVGSLGQSPELILNWNSENQKLQTCALAGTLQNSEEKTAEILKDKKINQEHEFVVQDIFDKLKKVFQVNQITKKTTQVLKLKHLLHLKTDFECSEVFLQQALQVIQVIHPTAALGLYPPSQNEFQNFSELSLQAERKNFAAPFAVIEKNQVLCVAAIRSFNFNPVEIQIFSGCGVTAQSVYESELAELELKRESVKRMMGIAE